VCADEVARARLASDVERGAHPARNRDPGLHAKLQLAAEPIEGDKLVVRTDDAAPSEIAERLCSTLRAPWSGETGSGR
jgi:hypothetical protein